MGELGCWLRKALVSFVFGSFGLVSNMVNSTLRFTFGSLEVGQDLQDLLPLPWIVWSVEDMAALYSAHPLTKYVCAASSPLEVGFTV